MVVRASYTLRSDNGEDIKEIQVFEGDDVARIGLPPEEKPVKSEPGVYSYTGSHDTGPLVPPREGGQIANLIAQVQKAKAFNDRFLTEIIEKEKSSPISKKVKTGD